MSETEEATVQLDTVRKYSTAAHLIAISYLLSSSIDMEVLTEIASFGFSTAFVVSLICLLSADRKKISHYDDKVTVALWASSLVYFQYIF